MWAVLLVLFVVIFWSFGWWLAKSSNAKQPLAWGFGLVLVGLNTMMLVMPDTKQADVAADTPETVATPQTSQPQPTAVKPFVKVTGSGYNESPVSISNQQLVQLIKATYPQAKMSTEKETIRGTLYESTNFEVSDQFTIGVSKWHDKDWGKVELKIREGQNRLDYYDAKELLLDECQKFTALLDDRLPPVIQELFNRLVEYENSGSSTSTQHVRYGYFFSINARHYQRGFPMYCSLGYE